MHFLKHASLFKPLGEYDMKKLEALYEALSAKFSEDPRFQTQHFLERAADVCEQNCDDSVAECLRTLHEAIKDYPDNG